MKKRRVQEGGGKEISKWFGRQPTDGEWHAQEGEKKASAKCRGQEMAVERRERGIKSKVSKNKKKVKYWKKRLGYEDAGRLKIEWGTSKGKEERMVGA